ncbi:MAG: transposase [Candidatus Pacebacteria bacterium]|nr:transposase [Candidatus Paceibacterota bacterium]
MLAALLIYCYATGRFESQGIEEVTYSHVAVRFITGDTHPDHDTIYYFRRRNRRATIRAGDEVNTHRNPLRCQPVSWIVLPVSDDSRTASRTCVSLRALAVVTG